MEGAAEQDVKSCEEFTRKRLREMEEVRSERLLEIGMEEEEEEEVRVRKEEGGSV